MHVECQKKESNILVNITSEEGKKKKNVRKVGKIRAITGKCGQEYEIGL